MIIKNARILDIYDTLEKMKSMKGTIFAYKIIKNQSIIEGDYKALQNSMKSTEKFNEYVQKRNSIIQMYFEQDTETTLKLKDNVKSENFLTEYNALDEEFKNEIAIREKQVIEFNKILMQDIDINFNYIDKHDLPEDISIYQINNIIEIIKNNDEIKNEVEMKNSDILSYIDILQLLNDINMCFDMKLDMIDNIRNIKNSWQKMTQTKEYVDYMVKYEQKRINICNKYSEKDVVGNPTMVDNKYKILDQISFNNEIKILSEENTDILKKYSDLLNEDQKLMFNKIKMEDLPKDITGNQMQFLNLFL